MVKKLSLTEVEQRLKARGLSLLGPYRGAKRKATIRCSQGHVWETTISSVVYAGHGCSQCANSGPRQSAGASIYVMQYCMSDRQLTKIGVAIDCRRRRTRLERSVKKPVRIKFIFSFGAASADDIYAIEKSVHQYFADFHAGESGFEGASELFTVTPDEAADYIRTMGGSPVFES